MQSHQSSFGEQISSAKSYGHKRRPSLGKSMPVTSLLLNFPPPPSTVRDYSTLSKDGLSPEFERPPIFFKIHEVNDCESSSDNDYEMLVTPDSNCNSCNSENQLTLVGDSKFYTPCLNCKAASRDNNSPLAQLCKKFCTKECSMEERPPLLRPPSRIELERKKFLSNMLCLKDDNDERSSADQQSKDVPELIEIVSDIIDKTTAPADQHHSSSVITPQESAMLKDFREKFSVAEALAKTSAMTSPAVKRRLAARKVEMELEYEENERRLTGIAPPSDSKNEIGSEYEPPRDLLVYLVR